MKRKRILILMASFAGGGAEKVMIDLLNRFDQKRYEITVAVLWGYGPNLTAVPEGIELLPLFNRGPGFWDNKTRSWRFIHNPLWRRRLLQTLGNRRFDVTISFMEGQTALLHSYIFDRAPINISWIHSDIYTTWWYSFLMNRDRERSIYSRMNYVVCVSEGVRDAVRKALGNLDNLRVIYNIIDREMIISRAAETDVEKKHFTIVNMGRLQPEKCQYRLIDAAAELKRRKLDFEIRIIGTGSLEGELRKKIEEQGVADRVKLLGYIQNPMPQVKAADLFALTSDAEGFSLVIGEALCLDKPVLSTRTAGPLELLAGDTGILIDYKGGEQLADEIEELMKNPDKLRYYQEKAHKKGLTFSPRDIMKKIENLWE